MITAGSVLGGILGAFGSVPLASVAAAVAGELSARRRSAIVVAAT